MVVEVVVLRSRVALVLQDTVGAVLQVVGALRQVVGAVLRAMGMVL